MKLQELLQKHAAKCDEQQAIVDKAVTEGRGMTDEEKTKFNELQKEIDDLAETIEAARKVQDRAKKLDEPLEDKKVAVFADPSWKQEEKLDDAGFKNIGEFLYCVKHGDSKGRLKNLATSDVGIMIPPAFSQNIMRLQPEEEIVAPRANVLEQGDQPNAEFKVPYLQQGQNGALGGVALYWEAEGVDLQNIVNPKIKDMGLKPSKIAGLCPINNETLLNWSAAGSFIENLLRMAFIEGRDEKFLSGSGVGVPLGILNSPGAYKVKRKTAGTIVLDDLANMRKHLLPQAYNGAFWIASIDAMPTLTTLTDGQGRLIWMPGNVAAGIPETILGLPVVWTGKTSLLGEEGDLVLCNLNPYYLIKPGAGPFVAISEHYLFGSDKTVFRIVAYVDGQLWVKEPLKLKNGVEVSPVVILKK